MGTSLGHSSGSNRLLLLDVLRGLAIIGTFLVNHALTFGGGFEMMNDTETYYAVDSWSIYSVAESFISIFANGKAYALLSILFGVGVAIQFDSTARRGLYWPGKYNWRAVFLFLEGTLHFFFVFEYDVLMGYAVTALLVAWLLTRSQKVQDVVMVIAGIVHLTILTVWSITTKLTDRFMEMSEEEFRNMVDEVRGEDYAVFEPGSYLDDIVYKFTHFFEMRWEPITMFPMTVFLFLLGVRLYRGGVFNNDARGRHIRNRMLIFGLGIGLPLAVSAYAWMDFGMFDRYAIPTIVALGYIGLVGFILDRVRKVGPLTTGMASLGRAALTGYVLQNVLMIFIVPLLVAQLNLKVMANFSGLIVLLFLMTFSYLWLTRYSCGPLEMVQKWALSKVPDRPAHRKDSDDKPAVKTL
ncbi:DUF418 domain-containing protein [Salipaludibacillus sp. LMS25]|uniref:DUF418 domain-containing protein n=1 Tax=Salipaludibacillus sp. LMS25 TaxID=2924031 RepID=UPI0020D158E2|nr:DUF418 domain-containing protein [Salipaludibacillus sp. LMS25]UTR16315.1 DUF418 domain-containing protein [Salipaludibacillus sp. LMS25]